VASSGLEVADVVRAYDEAYRAKYPLSRGERRTLSAITQCRTAALGGHLYECDHCGARHPRYNSCRNRHCPKCQGLDRAEWLEARLEDLLPIPYFHLVFTVPDRLHGLFLANREALYTLLFASAAQTLQELAADPKHLGAEIGFLSVLHTWSQTLTFHPHLHSIVTGGGLALDRRRWIAGRCGFLFPVRVLSRLFRGKFLAGLARLRHMGKLRLPREATELQDPILWNAWLCELYRKLWVVYAKPPFAGPQQVLTYLARYTHRIAISNARLVALEDDHLLLRYKNRSEDERWRLMRLPALEFLRRFLLHVLPDRFVRLRYYGLLAHRYRRKNLARCRELLGAPAAPPIPAPRAETWSDRLLRLTGFDVTLCPVCRQGRLLLHETLPPARATS
jgi:hypothetical protein